MTVQLDKSQLEPRYELNQLIAEGDLRGIIESFVGVLRASSGVVKQPDRGEERPTRPQEIEDWRFTPIIGYGRDGTILSGGSMFCQAVRRLVKGNDECMKSDLSRAVDAYNEREAVPYECFPAGLLDIVAPIVVGGHHLANVYLGQLRRDGHTFERVWDTYGELAGGGGAHSSPSKEQIRAYFSDLWEESDTAGVQKLQGLLGHVSQIISQRASRQAMLMAGSRMLDETDPSMDLQESMAVILRNLSRIFRFTTGGIFVLDEDKLKPCALLYPETLRARANFEPASRKGAIPYIFTSRKPLCFRSKEEMDRFCESSIERSRLERGLESFLGCPILIGDQAIGVIEIADEEPFAYAEDEIRLLERIAQYAAMFWRSNMQHRALTSIVSESNLDQLLQSVVRGIPVLVNGDGCSIFLRDMSRWNVRLSAENGADAELTRQDFHDLPAFLRATTELSVKEVPSTFYRPLEGLTGWVLATGNPLRLRGGKGARTTGLPEKEPPLKWEGKFRSRDLKHRQKDYYQDKPFLAVPIVGSGTTIYGVIRIADRVRADFTAREEQILMKSADALAAAIEHNVVGQALQGIRGDIEVLALQALRTRFDMEAVATRAAYLVSLLFAALALLISVASLASGLPSGVALASLLAFILCGGASIYFRKVSVTPRRAGPGSSAELQAVKVSRTPVSATTRLRDSGRKKRLG